MQNGVKIFYLENIYIISFQILYGNKNKKDIVVNKPI